MQVIRLPPRGLWRSEAIQIRACSIRDQDVTRHAFAFELRACDVNSGGTT